MCGELEDTSDSLIIGTIYRHKRIRYALFLNSLMVQRTGLFILIGIFNIISFIWWITLNHIYITEKGVSVTVCAIWWGLRSTCIFCRRHDYRKTFLFSRLRPHFMTGAGRVTGKRFPSDIFWWEMAPESKWRMKKISDNYDENLIKTNFRTNRVSL